MTLASSRLVAGSRVAIPEGAVAPMMDGQVIRFGDIIFAPSMESLGDLDLYSITLKKSEDWSASHGRNMIVNFQPTVLDLSDASQDVELFYLEKLRGPVIFVVDRPPSYTNNERYLYKTATLSNVMYFIYEEDAVLVGFQIAESENWSCSSGLKRLREWAGDEHQVARMMVGQSIKDVL